MALKKIGMVWVVVSNMDNAIKYYTETLGMKLLERNDDFGWAELGTPIGETRFGLAQQNEQFGMKAGTNATICVNVDDITQAKNDLEKKGVKFIGDIMEVPGHVKLQLFSDDDGNKFQLTQVLN